MGIGHENVKEIAKLAMLGLYEDEVVSLDTELGNILSYIEKLNQLDTENTDPSSVLFSEGLRTRVDDVKPSLGTKKALENAPESGDDHFLVPKII